MQYREAAFRRVCCLMALSILLIGCGKSGIGRIDVRGKVTFQGEPVPAGEIRFEPDRSRGGSGPAAFAVIVDGAYDTSKNGGKGPTPGPVKMTVMGLPSNEPFVPPLFPPITKEIEVSDDNRVFDISVPEE